MSGWGAVGQGLGALFGGGQDREERVYQDQLLKNATTADKMAAARINQLQAISREGVMADESLPMLQRQLLTGELASQFSSLQSGLETQQGMGFRDEAARLAAEAGYGVNAPLMALNGKPLELNQALAGGNLQGDVYLPGSDLSVTELGLADMFKDKASGQASLARAGASNASANASNARAGLYAAQTANPQDFRAPPRAGAAADPGVWSVKEVNEIIEFNRAASRPNSGRTPIEVPTPFTPKAAPSVEPVAPLAEAAPAMVAPPPQAIEMLRQNPALADQFDAKYGPGASTRVLKGQ